MIVSVDQALAWSEDGVLLPDPPSSQDTGLGRHPRLVRIVVWPSLLCTEYREIGLFITLTVASELHCRNLPLSPRSRK